MQAECMEDTRRGTDARHEKKKTTLRPVPVVAQTPITGDATFTEQLAADLAGELIEAFARDYSESGKDHAIAELLFSVRNLNTAYERRAASAALESLAGRIEAGIREYPNLVRAAEALVDEVPSEITGGNSERGRALHAARKVIRPLAAELSKKVR